MPSQISVQDAEQLIRVNTDVVIYDIRDNGSYLAGHIPGAQQLPHDKMQTISEEEKQKPVVIYCYHGISSIAAAEFLEDHGFVEVYSIIGGFTAWSESYSVSTSS